MSLPACFPPGQYLVAPNLMTRQQMRKHLTGHKWRHYVYGLCTETGLVFYIGKGTGMRALCHGAATDLAESRKNAAIKACGDGLRYCVIACCADDNYAAGLEALLLHENMDVLTNIAPSSMAAIARMDDETDPASELRGMLLRTQDLIRQMEASTEAAARRLVAAFPQFMDDLLPAQRAST